MMALSEKETSTSLAATMLRAPVSRMDVLTESEIQEINTKSKLVKKYSELIDRESTYEMLNKKIVNVEQEVANQEEEKATEKDEKQSGDTTATVTKSIIKILTSATFILVSFGVMSKLLRK